LEYDSDGNIIGLGMLEDEEETKAIENMIDKIWEDYDDDGNGHLDFEETMRFTKDFILSMPENKGFCEHNFT
jgi:hypothetical protein